MDAKGNIECWLQRLVDGMQDTVKQTTKRAVRNVQEMPLDDFIFSNPAQVRPSLLLASVAFSRPQAVKLMLVRTDCSDWP